MEINRIILNGVEYALTDAQAQAILILLKGQLTELKGEQKAISNRLDKLEASLEWEVFE